MCHGLYSKGHQMDMLNIVKHPWWGSRTRKDPQGSNQTTANSNPYKFEDPILGSNIYLLLPLPMHKSQHGYMSKQSCHSSCNPPHDLTHPLSKEERAILPCLGLSRSGLAL